MKSLKAIFKFNILDIADEHESEILSEMFNIFDPEDINEHLFCEKNNGWESIYCLNDLENQNKLINLFKNLGVLIDYEDLTKSVERGVFNLTDNTSEFGKAFQNFIRENLNVDYVLDKISKFGMDSLSEDELNFLKNSTQDI